MHLGAGRFALPITPLRFLWLIGLALMLSAVARAAEPSAAAVGEVLLVQGVATANRPGTTPRFVQRGETLHEGEVVSTGATGYTVIAFKDGTKFTLRPNTSFTIERYQHGAGKDSAVFRLLKGGMRAITGLISKRDPDAMQINTTTATIGIRGTSFDARLCEAECAAEQTRAPSKPGAATADRPVARVVRIVGTAQAIATAGQPRPLGNGSALFNGDSVRTDKASHVLLAFRDQSKVTVIADSEFKLEDVRFGPSPETGNFAVRILRGGVRALTGLLGKSNPKAVNFGVTTAVIGLRGSGWDAYIAPFAPAGQASAPAAFANTWLGATDLRVGDRTEPVDEGQTVVYTPSLDSFTRLAETPPFPDPAAVRPDTVTDIDFEALFREVVVELPGPGFHVGMRLENGQRVGEVVLRGPDGILYLAGEEGGWLPEGQGQPIRTNPNWASRMNSDLPAPETVGTGTRLEIRNPGGVICEI